MNAGRRTILFAYTKNDLSSFYEDLPVKQNSVQPTIQQEIPIQKY